MSSNRYKMYHEMEQSIGLISLQGESPEYVYFVVDGCFQVVQEVNVTQVNIVRLLFSYNSICFDINHALVANRTQFMA